MTDDDDGNDDDNNNNNNNSNDTTMIKILLFAAGCSMRAHMVASLVFYRNHSSRLIFSHTCSEGWPDSVNCSVLFTDALRLFNIHFHQLCDAVQPHYYWSSLPGSKQSSRHYISFQEAVTQDMTKKHCIT